jgi:hypothetical protein
MLPYTGDICASFPVLVIVTGRVAFSVAWLAGLPLCAYTGLVPAMTM